MTDWEAEHDHELALRREWSARAQRAERLLLLSEIEQEAKAKANIEKFIEEVTQPYRKFITETPALLSVLYDIDLLPEQIRLPINATRMAAFCELWQKGHAAFSSAES